MAIVTLANPLIYYSGDSISYWLTAWLAPLAIAGAAFALYALFFTKHARNAWPTRFFVLAWIFVVLGTVGPWINSLGARQTAENARLSDASIYEEIVTAEKARNQQPSALAPMSPANDGSKEPRLYTVPGGGPQLKSFDDLDAAGIGRGWKPPAGANELTSSRGQ
ncbi:hypothetical protein [Pantoea sp. 18069]|uniref:hypothetical protein n=1 Tax=Pantoea sp. 18069 TaxID=2681415 RepID=UPI001F16D161|nr:hypothetical protein [Pantoea sp. 18069]